MKKYLYLILFLLSINLVFSQRNVKLVVYQVYTNIGDCDGFGSGNSDPRWRWDGNGAPYINSQSYETTCNGCTRSISEEIMNETFFCSSDLPSSVSVRFRACENDPFGCDGTEGNVTNTISVPTGTGNFNVGPYTTFSNCGSGGTTYQYWARWEISGSFIATPSNNDICSAQNFGTINQSYNSGWQNFNNDCATLQSGEPRPQDDYNSVWYRFTTPAVGLVSVTGRIEEVSSSDNTTLTLYRSTGGCSFGSLTELESDYGCASGNTEISYDCLQGNTTYYFQAATSDCTLDNGETGNYRFRMLTSAYAAGPDDICDATSMGNMNGTSASLSENNQSNECATTQAGEFGGGQNTVWYTFTTGATVGYDFNVDMDAKSNGLNSDIYVYEICNNACSGSTPNWGNLTEIDNFFDVNPLPGEFDAGGTISGRIKSNSTYYVRADGTTTVGTTGGFDIDMSFSGGAYVANDNICNATTISTLAPGNNSTTNGTIDRSSSEDHCSLDEPNQDADETTVWYKYNVGASAPSFLSFDVDFGFGCNPDLRIYTGPSSLASCPFTSGSNGFSQLTYIADGGLDGFYEIECVLPNTTYYLQVDEDGLCSGTFSLELITGPAPPVNDLPCNAINVTTQPENTYSTTSFSGTNINGTNCFEPDPGWTLNANDAGVWYKLNAPGRNLIIDANSNSSDNIDLKLALYEGPCGNSATMTPNYIDRDYDAGSFDEDMYFSCLDPTKDYYLIVDGSFLNGEGNFDIEVYYPYEGGRSTCAANIYPARSIGTVPNSGSISYLNTSNLCGMSAAELASSGGPATVPAPPFTVDNAVWYTFRPPSSGSVIINANSDQFIGPALGFGSGDEVNLEMVVYESSDGSCQPASWTVTDYASYSNGVASYNEELIVNCLEPSKDYWLLVDGEFDASLITGGTEGYFDITIADYGVTTPNDLACDAIPFTTNPAQLNAWNACNSNYTITLNDQNNYCGNNLNEPTPSNWTPLPGTAKPIWYSFIAPPSGRLEIRLNTTTVLPWRQDYINGKLAVYDLPVGQNICSYVFASTDEVESDYDLDLPPASTGEDMTIECLEPGKTYYLMVDGKETALYPEWFRGEFSLEFESDPRDAPGPNDFICDAESLGNPTGGSVSTTALRPRGNLGDPYFCMGAENNFCMTATGDPSLPGFGLWSLDQTAWYTFIAPTTGSIRIDAINVNCGNGSDNIDIQLAVVESSDGTCTGTFNVLESEYDVGSFDETLEVHCLDEGTTYWLLVDGGGILDLVQGCFEVTITEIPATITGPVNDDVCNATPASPFSAAWSANNQTNSCASIEFGIPEPTAFDRDRTVWYSFTTPGGAGPYAVDVDVNSSLPWPFGDAMDPQLALYESDNGICSGTLSEVASEYNPIPFTESFEFHCLEPSTTYWLMVDGSLLNTQGDFSIDIEQITANPIAVNDDLCSYTDLGTLGASNGDFLGGTGTNYNNFCADVEVGEIVPEAYNLDQTVWFSFVTPTLGSPSDGLNIDLDVTNDPNGLGDQIDLQFAIFQSSDETCSGTLSEIESAYNPLGFSEEMKDICLKQNTRYFVQVDGGINTQGYFTIQATNDGVSAHPVNDDFCNAQSLSLGTVTAGNNECATLESGEPNAGLGVQKSVWYSFIAPPSGRVEIRTSDDDGLLGIDPEWRLYEFDGSCLAGTFTGTFTELANDYTPLFDDVEDYECLFPGQTYYVQVDGTTFIGDEGSFEITVTDLEPDYATLAGPANATDPEPINNGCDQAINLNVNAESCQYSTGTWDDENYGKPSRSIADISCGQNCGEIWYKFDMPATGFAKIEGNDDFGLLGVNNSELVVAAYRGSCGSFTLIECDLGGFNQDVDFSISGTPTETIYLQVFDNGGDAINENFQICVSERCAADDCEDALTAPSILGQGPQCFDVNDATGEDILGGDSGYGVGGVFGDNPENSVYYSFTTDNFCAGYVLTLTTTDVGSIGGLGGAELVMSIYEDDGSLCSHNVASEPLLDIQTFDASTYPSGVTYTITYEVGSALNNIKSNTTYVIQIEGNSTTVDGTIEVKKLCEGREWAYPTAPSTSSNGYCFDGTWRHYYNDNGTPSALDDILIFSIKSNGNVFDGTASIILDAAPGFAEDPGVEASWSMRRYWDFDLTSGSIDPLRPIDVKFYYLDAEKQEIITLAQNYATTNGLTYEAFEWFKSENGVDFNPIAHVTPPIVIAAYGSGSGPNITGDVIVQSTGVTTTVLCEDHDADPSNEFCNGVQYVEYVGLTGFSGGTGATGASNKMGSPLPVELLSFVGEKLEEGNQLIWKTATEINNDFFHLEHSTDGIVFKVIATIDGAGNSTITQTYTEIHSEFVESFNYYRLKNVDFDGSFELSDIVVIDNSVKEQEESMILLLYPNPSSLGQINLDAYIVNAGTYRIDVYDLLGKTVSSKNIDLVYGNNTVKVGFDGLSSGSYIIELVDLSTNKKVKKKFIRTDD